MSKLVASINLNTQRTMVTSGRLHDRQISSRVTYQLCINWVSHTNRMFNMQVHGQMRCSLKCERCKRVRAFMCDSHPAKATQHFIHCLTAR